MSRGQLQTLGLRRGAIDARLRNGSLQRVHRGVYAVGHAGLSQRGIWLGAVLACGDGATLSHVDAAALWQLVDPDRGPVDVTSAHGRPGRRGIRLHRAESHPDERATRHGIPVTTIARTLLDLAETAPRRLARAYEEADRRGLLQGGSLEKVCERGKGRHGLGAVQRLMAVERSGATRSPLEDDFVALCRRHHLPIPRVNARLGGFEVDALWPEQRLVVELDGFAYHRHRAAFERDRARDVALQAVGYRVIRFTHRRLEQEPEAIAEALRALLADGVR